MEPEFMQLLVNSTGAALVAAMFIWYLVRRDKEFSQAIRDTSQVMRDHSQADLEIQSKLLEGLEQLSRRIDASIIYNKKIDRKNTRGV